MYRHICFSFLAPCSFERGARRVEKFFPGMVLVAALAAISVKLSTVSWFQSSGISALTLAIVLGILLGNTIFHRVAAASGPGVSFSKQQLLRWGIILYGLRLTFQDVEQVGLMGVLVDTAVMCSTFGLSWLIGVKVFKLDHKTAMLIGAGSSICGAAAVMAAEPVVRGSPEQVTVAVSTVVVFGTLAMFLYPVLYHLNQHYHVVVLSSEAYGIYAGSTIHEIGQVVVASRPIGLDAANTAVITKMVRVMLLAPFLVALSACLSKASNTQTGTMPGAHRHAHRRIHIPWFALGFIAVTGLNSLGLLPKSISSILVDLDTAMLAMAMAALGLTAHFSAITKAGFKPLALAGLLFVWLVSGGIVINIAVGLSALR